MIRASAAAAGATLLILTGCATFLDSEKAGSNTQGIQYSLPIPVIRVTPQANGAMTVNVDYLPDPNNTYVIRTSSLISSYTLDVQRENGMLKSVSLDSKSDAVVAALTESGGNIIKARSDAEAKEQETAAAAAMEQAKALDEAQLAVRMADAKLTALKAAGAANDKILEASIALAEAIAKRDYLAGIASGANASSLNSASATSGPMAAGPVLFRVMPDKETKGVKLVAFEGPNSFPTSIAAKPIEKKPDLAVSVRESGVLTRTTGQPLQFELTVNRPVASVNLQLSKLNAIGAGGADFIRFVENANVNAADGGAVVIVTLRRNIPAGFYSFVPYLVQPGGQPMVADPVRIRVN